MPLHIHNHHAKRRAVAENVLFAVRTGICQEQLDMVAVTSTVLRGERKMVMTNSAIARSKKPMPTRTYQSHTAPRRFTEDVHSTRNPSWSRGSLQAERKAEKGDRLYSSLCWILGEMRIKKNSKGDLSKPRQVHYKTTWKRAQDAISWIHLAKAQDKGKTFCQTRSHAVTAYDSVPPDCIKKWYPRMVRRLFINDFVQEGQLQFSKVPGISSSSNSSSKVIWEAAGNN